MRTILHLTTRDVRHAFSNVMASIVIFGLIIIPSLFTWFNVIASWDPFSNTKNLKVAVASEDEGYQSDLVPIRVNIAEQVLSALRANDQLDWVVTSADDAIDGTRSGEYYAAIVLPPSFSADMMTFYTDGAERTELAYYTNEKKNALAPKITGQGAEGVSAQITEVFNETLGEVALGLVSSMSDYLTDADTQAALTRLESRVGAIATQLRAGAGTADMFSSLIDATLPLVRSASALVSGSASAFGDAADALGSGSDAVDELAQTLQSATAALSSSLSSTITGFDAVGTAVDKLYSSADALTGAQVATIQTLGERLQTQIDAYTQLRDTLAEEVGPQLPDAAQPAFQALLAQMDDAIARQQATHDALLQVADDLAAGNASAQDDHEKVSALVAQAKKALQDAQNSFDDSLKPQLDELSATLGQIQSDVSGIRTRLGAAADGLAGSSGSITASLSNAQSVTAALSDALGEAAGKFDALQQALSEAGDSGSLAGIAEIIGSDPSVLATSLAEPVKTDRIAVFPVAGFGAAMAPLYTVLALWVGALLMTVAIRVDVNRRTLPDRPEPTPTQKYLGRYGIFGLIGLAQSTLVTLGLVLFVQIEPAHPFLLILAGWVISAVFTLTIYTLVVAFGNAGKALSVLLLVIQISGSGGAYPLQLLPEWFQNVSPFLPATHAVTALRAAIAGIYRADFWMALLWLALFVLPVLLLGLVLRRPLISFNRKLAAALESTKLM